MPTTSNKDDRSPAAIAKRLEEAQGVLAKLRVPFAENQISLLPRNVQKGDTAKFGCKPGTQASADGKYCGGYHARSVHLDYVGHAALTDRLLTVDEGWEWEPLAYGEDGLPKFDGFGGLWIRLTVGGITRLGYGDAAGKDPSSTAVKEIIGDALRNAGMRFGMALDLWHKGDLHDVAEEQGNVGTNAPDQVDAPAATTRQRAPRKPAEPKPGVEALQSVIPDAQEIPRGVPDDSKAPDFLAQAAEAQTKAQAAQVWQAANRRFGKEPTKEQQVILDTIAKRGTELRKMEEQAEEANALAERQAKEALRQGFEPKDLV